MRPGSPEAAAHVELQRVENLMRDGERALAAGLFEYVADDLRAALRAVPPECAASCQVERRGDGCAHGVGLRGDV